MTFARARRLYKMEPLRHLPTVGGKTTKIGFKITKNTVFSPCEQTHTKNTVQYKRPAERARGGALVRKLPWKPATQRPSQNWMPCLGPTSQRRSPLSSSHFPRTVSSMSRFERSCTRCVYSAICPLSSGRSSVIQGAPLAWLRRIIFCGTRLRHGIKVSGDSSH